jgi:hypothetical protein
MVEEQLDNSASTAAIGTTRMDDIEDIDENHHHQDRNIESREKGTNDTTMTDNEQPTTRNQQQETTISRNTASATAGDFIQQFYIRPNNKDTTNKNTPIGVSRQ